ncbi:WD40 repeat-like protein [Infundibulicybe gibba]|nr:WD40 repeat-like protein [Infundibulicybe gibba]
MAASSSRQPHNISAPATPEAGLKTVKPKSARKGKAREHPAPTPKRAGVISEDAAVQESVESVKPWDWSYLTDSSTSKVPPIFTKDGSYFFSLVGASVKIYSTLTGQVVSTLSAPCNAGGEGPSDLTCAILNPSNAFQLITGSLSGHLMIWDYLDAALLQVIKVGQPVHLICAHQDFKDTVFVAVARPSKKSAKKSGAGVDDNGVVFRVSLVPTEAPTEPGVALSSSELVAIGKTRFPTGLAMSPSGAWIIVTAGHKAYVAMTGSLGSGFTKYVSPEHLTCLAFHPHEEYFATGDAKGNIRLWYCLNENLAVNARDVEKRTSTTSLHWHAHAVSAISFTANGAYLLSGGEEAVLVIWQLHTGKKEFVPRVGAPIVTVTLSKTDTEEYLLGLADATYLFVNAGTLKVSRSYPRIKFDPTFQNESTSTPRAAPLAVHPLTSNLILPSSHPSSLQIYSPSTSKVVSELEVSPSNRVSRRDEAPLEPARVERIVISASGEWMATVDSRNGDESVKGEVYLKFWRWDKKTSNWVLNTRVDRPHGLKAVTSASFSPTPGVGRTMQFVTTGLDGQVRVWRIRAAKDKGKGGRTDEYWTAKTAHTFRSELPTVATWSPDGSLLAVSIGPYITLYETASDSLLQTLTHPGCKNSTSLHFVGAGGRYLTATGKSTLFLWDLISQSCIWRHRGPEITGLIPHRNHDAFALFQRSEQQTKVSLFRPSSPTPYATQTLPFTLKTFLWHSLSNSSSFAFVGITTDWRVITFGDEIQHAESEGDAPQEITPNSLPLKRTLFQDIFGKTAFTETSTQSPSTTTDTTRHKDNAGGFPDVPTYLMPPIDNLFESIIKHAQEDRTERDKPASNLVQGDEDVAMDDADVHPVSSIGKRVVEENEILFLIDLFKTHGVDRKSPPPRPKPNGAVNGTKVNGTPGKVNGIASQPGAAHQKLAAGDGISGYASPPTPSSPPIPVSNGKKRKKLLS